MTKEDIVYIHLPNGKVYELILETKGKVLTDDEITQVRQLFGTANTIEAKVRAEKGNGLMQSRVLVLWGETLKNSYITINRY